MKSFLKIMVMLGSGWLSVGANAQTSGIREHLSEFARIQVPFQKLPVKSAKTPYFREFSNLTNPLPGSTGSKSFSLPPVLQQPLPPPLLAPDFILSQWGILCVGEYRLQQKTGLPLRFRLGSLEYVNALEGK